MTSLGQCLGVEPCGSYSTPRKAGLSAGFRLFGYGGIVSKPNVPGPLI